MIALLVFLASLPPTLVITAFVYFINNLDFQETQKTPEQENIIISRKEFNYEVFRRNYGNSQGKYGS